MKFDEQVEEEPEEPEETRMAAAASAPSKQMREEHEAQNHAVYRSWCEICVQSRGLGTQHKKKKQTEAIEDAEGPRIFSDYFFMSTDEQSMPMLALKFSRSKRVAATARVLLHVLPNSSRGLLWRLEFGGLSTSATTSRQWWH